MYNNEQLTKYLHLSLSSPPIPTLIMAINNHFLTIFPQLTIDNVRKHLHYISEHTAAGHSCQPPSNFQSTQQNYTNHSNVINTLTTTYNISQSKVFTDLIGKFPITSTMGHQYISITYCDECNTIISHPMCSRHTTEWTTLYTKIH